MNVDLASVIWDELKRYINTVDRAEAAENLVSVLIDNDCDPDDIKDAFKGDTQIKNALADYVDDLEDDEEDDDEGIDEDEPWDD